MKKLNLIVTIAAFVLLSCNSKKIKYPEVPDTGSDQKWWQSASEITKTPVSENTNQSVPAKNQFSTVKGTPYMPVQLLKNGGNIIEIGVSPDSEDAGALLHVRFFTGQKMTKQYTYSPAGSMPLAFNKITKAPYRTNSVCATVLADGKIVTAWPEVSKDGTEEICLCCIEQTGTVCWTDSIVTYTDIPKVCYCTDSSGYLYIAVSAFRTDNDNIVLLDTILQRRNPQDGTVLREVKFGSGAPQALVSAGDTIYVAESGYKHNGSITAFSTELALKGSIRLAKGSADFAPSIQNMQTNGESIFITSVYYTELTGNHANDGVFLTCFDLNLKQKWQKSILINSYTADFSIAVDNTNMVLVCAGIKTTGEPFTRYGILRIDMNDGCVTDSRSLIFPSEYIVTSSILDSDRLWLTGFAQKRDGGDTSTKTGSTFSAPLAEFSSTGICDVSKGTYFFVEHNDILVYEQIPETQQNLVVTGDGNMQLKAAAVYPWN